MDGEQRFGALAPLRGLGRDALPKESDLACVYAWTAYLVFAWLTAVLSEQLDCCGLDELVSVSFFGEMT